MRTCEYDGEPFTEPRSHPWTDAAADPKARYHDFTATPELIRTSLEDFEPFRRYAAISEFYEFLERVNHPKSALESNDCAFSGPHPNEGKQVSAALECSGRVMLFYRNLELNTEKPRVAWLKTAFHYQLAHLDPKFSSGIIGTTLVPVRFLALPEQAQLGQELMLSFWAFGDTEATTMQSLSRLLKNLSQALRGVSARIV